MEKNIKSGKLDTEVESFLNAVDSVLNSNTFLVEIPLIEKPKDLNDFLSEFIKSISFKELMIEQSKRRGLSCYTSYDVIDDELIEVELFVGEFYKQDFDLSIEKLSYSNFKKILLNMVTTDRSFYRSQLPYEKANQIVNAFLNKIFKDKKVKKIRDEWELYSIKPDFLNSTYIIDEKTGEDEINEMFCYFDDFGFDSCTVFFNKEKLYMLLTNGMP